MDFLENDSSAAEMSAPEIPQTKCGIDYSSLGLNSADDDNLTIHYEDGTVDLDDSCISLQVVMEDDGTDDFEVCDQSVNASEAPVQVELMESGIKIHDSTPLIMQAPPLTEETVFYVDSLVPQEEEVVMETTTSANQLKVAASGEDSGLGSSQETNDSVFGVAYVDVP